MALTATAQSAFPREWDDVIVPALRQRLKDESNVLAKRISTTSIVSGDDHPSDLYPSNSPYSSPGHETSTPSHYYYSKPSAIPRPSLQQSRPYDLTAGSAGKPTSIRARTLSQPFPFDESNHADLTAPPMEASRPISPATSTKGTRIPISRARAGSTSSQAQTSFHGSVGRTNGSIYTRYNGDTSTDSPNLYPVDERHQPHPARSTARTPTELDESLPERMSSDSEERPFEHWYRGDIARNGGVGELRVGRRQEMLDIANYGHTFRKASARVVPDGNSRSRSTSRGKDVRRVRARAESVGTAVGARESIYIDDDERARDARMVLDEQPLTDLDSDSYEDEDPAEDPYERQEVTPHPYGTISSPAFDRSATPTSVRSRQAKNGISQSRIPTPTHRTPPPRTPTPTRPIRGASEPGTSSPRSKAIPRSNSHPQTAVGESTSTAKRRAKSPAASTPSGKKMKTRTPPSSMQKKTARTVENRRSIGQYPPPEGDEDAIPSWTQPVQASGNWDDVVLPVVARKKGLEGHYEKADGSPRPKQTSNVYEPAPGTFGYDHSKYRPPREGMEPEDIPMDEFGQKTLVAEDTSIPDEQSSMPAPQPTSPHRTESDSLERTRLPSPPPFAHYAGAESEPTLQTIQATDSTTQRSNKERQDVEDEDVGAGCCKCVIM